MIKYLGALIAFSLGCSGGSEGSPDKIGELGEACYANQTCNTGLLCENDICVDDTQDAGVSNGLEGAFNQIIGEPIRNLDVLFVVDNSSSMAEKQTALANNFSSFTSVLNAVEGGLPDMHIGIVSTNLGAGPYNINGCSGNGDNGLLQNEAASSQGCPTPTDRYISDVAGSNGTRVQNFSGTISETFSCIAQLGTNGCGFEQPLEAMRRALDGSNGLNAGFLRDDAMLAVIVLSDEDDCSTEDVTMFNSDSSLNNANSSLGFLSSFRCFEFGVVCDPDTPRTPGARQNCTSREDSLYMHDIGGYASFLRELKNSKGNILYTSIAPVGDVSVILDEIKPVVAPACGDSEFFGNTPSVRLSALGETLGMPPTQNACGDLSIALRIIGESVASMMSGQCLPADITSSECRIADVAGFGTSAEVVSQELPSCSSSTTGPCSTQITNSGNCPGAGTEIIIDRRGSTAPANTVIIASCS